MMSLIFLLTAIALIVLIIRLFINVVRRRSVWPSLKIILIVVALYSAAWLIFYWSSKNVVAPLGTAVCFDDWCATVTQTESGPAIQKQFERLHSDSSYIIIHIRMINQARGITQAPSDPRVHILDKNENAWTYSARAQKILELTSGPQPGIGHRLELHQSLETLLVFAVPKTTDGLNVLIEEGPPITRLIFPEDKMVFAVK